MNYFSEMFDLFDSELGNYNLITKSDKDGWHLTYDFEDEDGKGTSIHVDGDDFMNAAEKLIQKTSDWYNNQEDEDEEVRLEDLTKEELIDIILEQTDIIKDFDSKIDDLQTAYTDMVQAYDSEHDRCNRLEEKIDDLHISLNEKTKILDNIIEVIR